MQKLISAVIESGHGSHDRARRLHVRDQRRVAHAVAPARAPSRRRRLRPAEPALRRRSRARPRCCRTRSPRATRTCASRYEEQVDGSLELYGELRRRRGARRGCPVRLPERDAHEPRHDDEPARAHPHVRPAPVHDGPVGDPPALPADPPRDLQRVARSSASFLAPKCVPLGYCDEIDNRDEHCPIRPHKDRVLDAWAEKAAAARAAGRELPVSLTVSAGRSGGRRGRRGTVG